MATTGSEPQQSEQGKWLPLEPNPALIEHARERAESAQNRFADRITAFAGSMAFVYLSVLWFGCWIAFGVEEYPYPLLTMIVSLEAIFLSTFVLISQNRTDAKRQVIADQAWKTVQVEDKQNEELLDLSHQILELTKHVHTIAVALPDVTAPTRTRDSDPPS
jgi:uncharacterized membrane protein